MKVQLCEDLNNRYNIKSELQENGGYCPCSLIHNEDTKCMCKEFREQDTLGPCHCGLYEKVEE